MQPIDFIEQQILQKCTRAGVRLDIAKRHAGVAMLRYGENRFNSVADLIIETVASAKKANVK